MPYAEVNGQRLRYEDTGGDGPPMIFSHGFLMDREMFAPQAAALAPEFRVIAWDERGFGETEFDGQPFTYWDSARRLLRACSTTWGSSRRCWEGCHRAASCRCARRCSSPRGSGRWF